MSRSYKKTPYCGDKKGKSKKRFANSKVRNVLKNFKNKLPYMKYKRVYEQYDICDYGWIRTWDEYWKIILNSYKKYPELYKYPPNKKDEYRSWYKYYKMK